MLQWIKENPEWVAIILISLLEYWLGKTKKVQSNSIVSLFGSILKNRGALVRAAVRLLALFKKK